MPGAFQCSNKSHGNPKASALRLLSQERVYKQAQKVVLVMVDDDEDDCYLVEAALKDASFNCIFRCIQDGREMMDYLQHGGKYRDPKSAPYPDLILLDLNMPGINGRDLLARLKTDSRFRSIPVIILATSSDPENIRACYDLGANSYVVKQLHFDGLLPAIRTLKDYWLELATLPPRNHA